MKLFTKKRACLPMLLATMCILLSCVAYAVDKTEYEPITLFFTQYQCGIVNKHNSATVENVIFEGREAVKVVPNPEYEDTSALRVDAYKFEGSGVDIGVYKWLVIEYKYVSENPGNYEFIAHHKTNGGLLKEEYTQSAKTTATEKLTAGDWQYALFDFTFIDKMLVENLDSHLLRQMHISPFGDARLQNLSSEDTVYIGRFTFFKDKPDLKVYTSIANGYEDGSFRPGGFLTRAEACALAARSLATDKEILAQYGSGADWSEKYVSFCRDRGLTKSLGGNFDADGYITRGEFSRLTYFTELYMKGEPLPSTVVDIAYDKSLITREDAVRMLNTIRGFSKYINAIDKHTVMLYTDVSRLHRSFFDIFLSCNDFLVSGDTWLYNITKNEIELGDPEDYAAFFNLEAGRKMVLELDELEERMIKDVRARKSVLPDVPGYIYYVSPSGNDNDYGYNAQNAFKTLARALSVAVSGDAILLERGSVHRGNFAIPAGITLGAYGTGDKPKIYGSPMNGADPDLWSLDYEDDTGAKIWKFAYEGMTDVGNIVFDDGRMYAYKDIPSCVSDGTYRIRGDEEKVYDYKKELDFDLNFFHRANSVINKSKGVINIETATGPLYLRCDAGNPGSVFSSIEFSPRGNTLGIKGAGVTIDNLCIMFAGSHGIGSGTNKNLTVTNCELGWIGGSVQHYNNTNNRVTRFGNGVEIYGGCDGYLVENCYVYQCYDAGITHQFNASGGEGDYWMYNVTYRGNLITDCVYSIEYFFNEMSGQVREGDNILFEENVMRRCGFGFGSTRPNGYAQRHIRSNPYGNPFTNFVIRNNILDRSVQDLFRIQFSTYDYAPEMYGNTYIVGLGNDFFTYGIGNGLTYKADISADAAIRTIPKDTACKLYFTDKVPYYTYTYNSFS